LINIHFIHNYILRIFFNIKFLMFPLAMDFLFPFLRYILALHIDDFIYFVHNLIYLIMNIITRHVNETYGL